MPWSNSRPEFVAEKKRPSPRYSISKRLTECAASLSRRFQASEALSTLRRPVPELFPHGGLLRPRPSWCAHLRARCPRSFSRPDISSHCLRVVPPTSATDVLWDPQNPPERSSLSHHSASEPQRRPKFVCKRCQHERYSQTLSARALFGANKHSLILLASGAGGGACTVTVVEQSHALWTPFSARPVMV